MDKMVKRAGPVLLLGLLGCDARPTVFRAEPPVKADFPRSEHRRPYCEGTPWSSRISAR
jgi:hypothetical protein